MESALGVPIPYWDSTLDFEMEDPTESILWTKKYLGNGFGLVKTGPFADFQTPLGPLFRNIGSDGCLFENKAMNGIFRYNRLAHISEPTAEESVSLEGQHNSIHNWVDGQMNNIDGSAHDPVFFVHHSFVDHIWETFRGLQLKYGIDPTTDTVLPPENVTLQNVTDPAVGLTGYYNEDGYSVMIATMVKYMPRPQCPFCSGSSDLYCDKSKGLCVSKRRNPREYRGRPEEAMPAAMDCGINSGGAKSHPFRLYERDARVRMDSVTMNYTNSNETNDQSNNRSDVRMNDAIQMNHVMINGNLMLINKGHIDSEHHIVLGLGVDVPHGEALTRRELLKGGFISESGGTVKTYGQFPYGIGYGNQAHFSISKHQTNLKEIVWLNDVEPISRKGYSHDDLGTNRGVSSMTNGPLDHNYLHQRRFPVNYFVETNHDGHILTEPSRGAARISDLIRHLSY